MSHPVRCPYCLGGQGRCTTLASSGRAVTECASCGRVVEEHQSYAHDLFVLRAQDSPLCVVTPDLAQLPLPPLDSDDAEGDPFENTGFITAFSTWSLELHPVFAHTTTSFSGHLAEMERVLQFDSADPSASLVDNLRAYLQIVDVSSILGVDRDISDHAVQLFRDCASTTCLRNRNIEALATAALLQAIREAQEPRTLQEISASANVAQKEIGKYLKFLVEALKLSQPINSNSISVHMPRFCTLLQLDKSTQDLATYIGEVVTNKCFCTRRNPISISAAAIYLSCQLEDKRKTQAEICKVTGLTEVTLRKVYKELLENRDDLLPPDYTPAVPLDKAFPMTTVASGRSTSLKPDVVDLSSSSTGQAKLLNDTTKPRKIQEGTEGDQHQQAGKGKEKEAEYRDAALRGSPLTERGNNNDPGALHWQSSLLFRMPALRESGSSTRPERDIDINEAQPCSREEGDCKHKGAGSGNSGGLLPGSGWRFSASRSTEAHAPPVYQKLSAGLIGHVDQLQVKKGNLPGVEGKSHRK
ncbi:Transcription initiation factor IIB [Nymphaea thermarum]|nr:Transcription initiation factor IIB [Nymphaea thermarum]